jgi:hypothetical protein
MTITITSLRIRSLWTFFRLSWLGLKISMQVKKSPGFIKMKNTGFGYMHYTITVWKDVESMKEFMKSGAHAEAMKISAQIANEIGNYTYQSDVLPSWKEAKELMKKGSFKNY